jgi:hypothetical protein
MAIYYYLTSQSSDEFPKVIIGDDCACRVDSAGATTDDIAEDAAKNWFDRVGLEGEDEIDIAIYGDEPGELLAVHTVYIEYCPTFSAGRAH